MKKEKIEKLKKGGWKVGTVQEFLNASNEDMALIELKRALIRKLKETRRAQKITQQTLAKLLSSSQSRVAKLESTTSGISLDLICRSLFVMGVTPREVGEVITRI